LFPFQLQNGLIFFKSNSYCQEAGFFAFIFYHKICQNGKKGKRKNGKIIKEKRKKKLL
jgi:hypothetical protein